MAQRIAICAIVKNEGRYLEEWIAYHHVIGADHFFIYDNESSDDTATILRRASEAGICTTRFWEDRDDQPPQQTAYRHMARDAAREYDWMLFLDADEFVNLKVHSSLHHLLDDYDEADAIWISWRVFGDNGHIEYEPGLVMERFTRAAATDFSKNRLGKSIVRARALLNPVIHNHELTDDAVFIHLDRTPAIRFPLFEAQNKTLHDVAQINHYLVKSKAEWNLKRSRGRGTKARSHPQKLRREDAFAVYNRNEEFDDSILARRAETVAAMDALFGKKLDTVQ